MKQPKKLTRSQKECLSANLLKSTDWMLICETDFYLKIVNKSTGEKRCIDKFRKETRRL